MPALRRVCYKGFQSIGGLCCLVSARKVPLQKYHLVPQIRGTIIGGASCSGGKPESLFSHVSMRNMGTVSMTPLMLPVSAKVFALTDYVHE